MKMNRFWWRLLLFIAGVFTMSFGVALSIKANLGVSPISCIPYIYSQKYPFTVGEMTIAFNILLILLQILLYRKKYRPIQLIQLPVVFIFGYFIDLTLSFVQHLQATEYIFQFIYCMAGLLILALGVFMEVKAGITYLPGEGLVVAIVDTFRKEFGRIKIYVDSSMVVLGLISSLVLLHNLTGIREGTVLAAVLVGVLVRWYDRKLFFVSNWLNGTSDNHPEKVVLPEKQDNLIITISREFGSGGHEIGQLVAQKLGVDFYDRKLIELTALGSGFSQEYVELHEQKLNNALSHELYEQNYAFVDGEKSPIDLIFDVQSRVIREVCSQSSCVIVGRCANFVLQDKTNCLNVFIHANAAFRRQKIQSEYGIKASEVDKVMKKNDHERSEYCRYFTKKNWSETTNYHLTIDSSLYSVDEVANMIVQAAKKSDQK